MTVVLHFMINTLLQRGIRGGPETQKRFNLTLSPSGKLMKRLGPLRHILRPG
jgi:hypothetical protein